MRTTDMTVGNPMKLILKFALPLILANLGQQLYMIVDAAIVGRGVGVKALAAVGAADWTYWLVLWATIGLTQGFSVFISRYFGDKNYSKMNKTIAMSIFLCGAFGIVLTAVGVLVAGPVLELLETPKDIIDDATVYLVTMISGTLVVMAYNMASAVSRALGDGKTPLISMLISAFLNIVLDLIFVMVFHWGVFGAAFASVLSQAVSFVYCFIQIRKIKYINIEKEMWKPDFKMMKELVFLALPLSLQHIIISLGGIILQSTVNLQGSVFVAGYTAVNKLYGLLESTAISFGTAFSTFFAQNFGAGNSERVRKGVKSGIILCVISSVVVSVIVWLTGKYLLQVFLDVSNKDGIKALEIGLRFLIPMIIFMSILYLIYVYRCVLQSVGISVWSMISGFSEFVVRVGMGKFVVLWLGVDTLYYIEPAAWLGALITVMIPYYLGRNKYLVNN